ncbi:chromate transporter [Eubacterium aggregans]|uniref:chromate transporter n=1 Tax=Eubacterium aggregans TaxID=81409 RepID=UPI003F393659
MSGRKLWDLFITLLKIGAFTFGGGYAMIPMIQNEIVNKKGYITEEEFMDMIAIVEATPGVIAVNTATFVGYRVGGFLGGLLAIFGVVLPSFVIISIIAQFYEAFRQNQWVSYAFLGIRAGVIVLIFGALVRMAKNVDRTPFIAILVVGAFGIAAFTGINVVFIILAGAMAGVLRQLFLLKKGGGDA